LIRHDHIEKDVSKYFSSVARVFVAVVTFLPNYFLATITRYTYRHTDRCEGFMKYAVEMGSGAKISIPSFIKIGSINQKFVGGIQRHAESMMTLWTCFYFFKQRKQAKNVSRTLLSTNEGLLLV
jgi:hypothetical protein